MVFASIIFHLLLEASTPPFVPAKEPVNLSTTSDLILRSPSEARASRRMAASPNLLPWFETARYARLLTMRPSVLELAPKSPGNERFASSKAGTHDTCPIDCPGAREPGA